LLLYFEWACWFSLLASVRLCCAGGPRHQFGASSPRAQIGACADAKLTIDATSLV
jgi:hypothetical protein